MEQGIVNQGNNQLAAHQPTKNLLTSILLLEKEGKATLAKINLVNEGVRLIPSGVVNFEYLKTCPSLKSISVDLGVTKTQTLLVLLIKNFCSSFNVVRNMSEDQAIECAVYLLEECRDFTIEDYVIMFTLAKRGKLGDILDHIDIEVIGNIHQEYLGLRMAYFKVNKPKLVEPENVNYVGKEKVISALSEWTKKMTVEANENRDNDRRSAAEALIKYNEMLRKQAEKVGKIDTTKQIPDQCENEIPN